MLKGFAAGLVALALVATPAAADPVSGFYAGIYGGVASPSSIDYGLDIVSVLFDGPGTIEVPSSIVNNGVDPVFFDYLNTALARFPFADLGFADASITDGRLDLMNAVTYGAVVGYGFGNGVRVEADVSSASFIAANYVPETGFGQSADGIMDGSGVWTWTEVGTVPFPPPPPPPTPLSFFGLDYSIDVQFMLVSGYYDFDTGTAISPYLGGGAGLARVTGTLTDLCGCGTFTTSVLAPAAQLGGGVRIALADPVTLDLGYRYKMAVTQGLPVFEILEDPIFPAVFGFATQQSGIIGVHTLQAGLTFALP
jgi:opacity protein-like surface antigen